ncbi:MAG: hypothetical protein L6R42_009644 [Xanthoria sp. 1 TBL-2021]|nr:MAG: hypothetical protein L6R42_009644 [Xanthoria sp. 1 TBL-2021]
MLPFLAWSQIYANRRQLFPVHILCGPSQTDVKVMPEILSSSPFRHEYARQQPASNNMTMYLPDDTAGAVTRLLVNTNGDNSYLKYPRERNLSNAEEIVQDYLISTKYKVQQVKNDIIRFLGSIDVACTEEPCMFHLDTDGFKALMFKGGYLAMDVFDVHQAVRADHQRCLDSWTKAERDAEEEQRLWEMRSQLLKDEEKARSTYPGAGGYDAE